MASKEDAMSLLKEVETQVPNTPEARLMFAVFSCAIQDCFIHSAGVDRRGTRLYLAQDKIEALEAIDIKTEWVRRKFNKIGLML